MNGTTTFDTDRNGHAEDDLERRLRATLAAFADRADDVPDLPVVVRLSERRLASGAAFSGRGPVLSAAAIAAIALVGTAVAIERDGRSSSSVATGSSGPPTSEAATLPLGPPPPSAEAGSFAALEGFPGVVLVRDDARTWTGSENGFPSILGGVPIDGIRSRSYIQRLDEGDFSSPGYHLRAPSGRNVGYVTLIAAAFRRSDVRLTPVVEGSKAPVALEEREALWNAGEPVPGPDVDGTANAATFVELSAFCAATMPGESSDSDAGPVGPAPVSCQSRALGGDGQMTIRVDVWAGAETDPTALEIARNLRFG